MLFEFLPKKRKRVEMPDEALAAIRRGLWRAAVNEDGGTAYSVRLRDVEVAGKTGTAQVHKIGQVRVANRDKEFRFRDHAWFASYAPADDPEIVIVVFLQHGGHGGSDAAPVAMRIYEEYFHAKAAPEAIPLSERISEIPALPAVSEQPPDATQPSPEPTQGQKGAMMASSEWGAGGIDPRTSRAVGPYRALASAARLAAGVHRVADRGGGDLQRSTARRKRWARPTTSRRRWRGASGS